MLASTEVLPAETVEFRILGPFEVVSDGRPLPLAPGQERVLLAILLLHRNERVSTDRLVDLLWDESPPESAPKMVQIYVSRLRRRLAATVGADERLVTEAAGYRLRVESDELDLERFERLFDEGRRALAAGDPALAAATLREALSLWRGGPLADFGDGRFLERERARLEGLRLSALEERIEADFALGAGAALVDELQALVREQPLRERPVAQLMLALYRSGRQAEALATYKEARDSLVDELGIEPGRPLKELEQAILRQDPALEAPSAREEVLRAGESAAPEPSPRRLARRKVAVTAAATIAIAAAVAVAIALGGNGRGQIRLTADAIGLVRDGRIVERARLGAAPSAIAAGGGQIWLAGADSVTRLDPKTFQVRQTIAVGNGPSGIALGRGAVWVTNGLDGTVSRIDPKANKVVQTIHVGNGPVAIAYGLGSLWVANRADQTVSQIDPRTGVPLDTLGAGTDAAAIAVGEGAVWVVDQASGRIARLEPGFTEPAVTINVGNGPAAMALGAGSLWVANTLDSTVMRIDPRSERVIATIPVGAGPSSLAVAQDGIWVGNQLDGTLWRIDPHTDRVDRKTRLGQRPEAIAAGSSGVLVAVGASAASHRGGTLRLAANGFPYGSIDPLNLDWPAVTLTNDGLTGFRRVGGIEGTELVPDLALSLPTPTEGGTTYTFRLRPDIRYSDGRVVRPEDVRRALKRSLIVSHAAFYYSAIIGATQCAARPGSCDLSRGIEVDDRASTVTFHLSAPDSDFLFKLALPFAYAVPAGTPNRDVRTHPVPATGPYMIAAFKPGRFVRLVRNPRFHVWSDAAQPAGYADRIVWRLRVRPAAQVAAVESGKTDVAFDGVPPDRLAEVKTRYATQVRENPLPRTTFAFLNTRVPPFDDVRVRRAVSYAADRTRFVASSGGPDRAQPTCQVLPPNFPGYRPYCPFTIHPGSAGLWSRPDLAKAQRLVAASGTRGAKVTVWIPTNRRAEGEAFVTLLKQLGYRARPKDLPDNLYYPRIGDPRLRIQAGVLSWVADFPGASNFIAFFFRCPREASGLNPNPSQFCVQGIDREIDRALSLEATDPAIAASVWARLDRQIVDRAPMVPLVNPKQVDFVSRRVNNYQYNPQLGVLLDQLWVR